MFYFKTRIKPLALISAFILFVACTEKKGLPDTLEAGWQGEAVCEELLDNAEMRVLKCTFPPGVGHEKHYHQRYFGYALAGGTFRITDTTGTRDVELPTGSSFYNEGLAWHEVLNIGDSTAIYLIVEPK